MPNYYDDPGPAIPPLPVPIEEAGFGYAIRYPGRRQPWHWWAPDPERPNARIPIKCSTTLFATNAEIAIFDKFIQEDPSCHKCMQSFQMFLMAHGLRPGSKLDADFKRALIRLKK